MEKNNGKGIDEMKNLPATVGCEATVGCSPGGTPAFVRKVIQWDKRPLYVPNFRTSDLGGASGEVGPYNQRWLLGWQKMRRRLEKRRVSSIIDAHKK